MFNSLLSRYITLAVILLSIFLIQHCEIRNLKKNIKDCRISLDKETIAKKQCLNTLDNQNAVIEQFRLSEQELKKAYKKELDNITKQMGNRKAEVIEIIKKDPSCENQLQLILDDQKRFLNGL